MTPPPMNPGEIARFIATGEIEQDTFDKLFDHYCNNGEMPYGVAKARTGDPYQWIAERLTQEFAQ